MHDLGWFDHVYDALIARWDEAVRAAGEVSTGRVGRAEIADHLWIGALD